MSDRFLALAIVLAVLAPSQVAAQAGAAAAKAKSTAPMKTWTPPLTPDGQVDLQGVWVSNSATPLERPKALEGRPLLTDEEVGELKRRAERIFNDGGSAYGAGDTVFLSAFNNVDRYNGNSTENSVEMIEREFENR